MLPAALLTMLRPISGWSMKQSARLAFNLVSCSKLASDKVVIWGRKSAVWFQSNFGIAASPDRKQQTGA